MVDFLKYLEGCEHYRNVTQESSLTLDDSSTDLLHVAINHKGGEVRVTSRDNATKLILISNEERSNAGLNITIEAGARLELLELMCNFSKNNITVNQSADSILNSTVFQLSNSAIDYKINMIGKGADTQVNILQLPSDDDKVVCDLKISHNSPNCTSRSTSKCVAGGKSIGEFHGLVFVAPDAQQTLSEQSSRNVALSSDAKIIAEPQLEIYADDVQCTHGATVGQMDREAVLYMRQRGLSEDQARKVQLDGFVADVTSACGIEVLKEPLQSLVQERLHKL